MWLVSVKMVSEGVDIPRLRVGAYLTNIKAELYFRQLVGRFVRMLQHLKHQDAHIFMPKDKDFMKLAVEINIERDHALDEVERSGGFGDSPDKDLFGNDAYVPALEGRFIPLGSELTDGTEIVTTVGISNGMKKTTVKTVNDDSPVFEQAAALKKRCQDMAKVYAIKQKKLHNLDKPDWKVAHKIYIASGGVEMRFETLKGLKQRVQFYRGLLK
jgi:superfamily II DNA or RNA helicase